MGRDGVDQVEPSGGVHAAPPATLLTAIDSAVGDPAVAARPSNDLSTTRAASLTHDEPLETTRQNHINCISVLDFRYLVEPDVW